MQYSQDHPATDDDQSGHRGMSFYHEHLESPRSSLSSVGTYTSTLPSEEYLTYQQPFEVLASGYRVYGSDATPSSPAEFAALFPSNRTLLIRHDDATSDGNMNLRIDTYVHGLDSHQRKLTLFHLRMHDLKDRRFSLRRYCRDSGREVCSSNRKYASTTSHVSARSNIQQSLGTAFQQFRLTHEASVPAPKRGVRMDVVHDSSEDHCRPRTAGAFHSHKAPPSPTNTIQLDFSNYAHVDIDKRGSKRHEHELWGMKYTWKRQMDRHGDFEEVSYHLIRDKTSKSIAHITPKPLTTEEAQEEEESGGWVPPCTMRITDESVFRGLTDVAE